MILATKISYFQGILPFSALPPKKLEEMISLSSPMTYPKGKTIFLLGENAHYFYVTLSGWIKLYRETIDGEQSIIDVLPKNHLFGQDALFHANTYTCSAEAAETAELVAIPLTFLKQETSENTIFAVAMLQIMAKTATQKDRELEHHSLQNAPQRIGCFLLRLADANEKGAVTIHLPYDKSLIAMRLGMQPETFSRGLNKLKEETGIIIQGATVTLESISQLSNYCCSACTSEFPCKDLAEDGSLGR